MNFKNNIARIKNFITRKPQFLIEPQAPIKVAFISGGVTYYMFEDIFSLPCQRAFEATTYYEEMKSGISAEYLKLHLQAMDTIISNTKEINLTQIIMLQSRLKERNEFMVDADIVFKLASVLYFDKSENPYAYDMKYNHSKIVAWKKDNDVADFFLSTPIKTLLPFTDMLEQDLNSYLKVVEKMKKRQKNEVLSIISKRAAS